MFELMFLLCLYVSRHCTCILLLTVVLFILIFPCLANRLRRKTYKINKLKTALKQHYFVIITCVNSCWYWKCLLKKLQHLILMYCKNYSEASLKMTDIWQKVIYINYSLNFQNILPSGIFKDIEGKGEFLEILGDTE